MGMTVIIGANTYGPIVMAAGSYAMNIKVSAPRMKKDRFHVPGVDGNYIIRHGMVGRTISVYLAYVGTYASVGAAIAADRDNWGKAAVQITDDVGTIYTACNLEGYNRISGPTGFKSPDDSETWIIIEAEAIFEQDVLTNP
jgi:hypothetical protein